MARKAKVPAPKKMSTPALHNQDPPGTQYRCTCCGDYYTTQQTNFFRSYSKLYAGWGGYYPVCKKCLSIYYSWLLAEIYDGDEFAAMRRMLQLLDLPYDEEVMLKAMRGASDDSPLGLLTMYVQRLNTTSYRKNNATYIHTVLNEAEQQRREEAIQAQQEAEETAEAAAVASPEETIPADIELWRRWGSGFSEEEYEYLEMQYADWVDCYACETKIQEELFKNICLAQLNINKAQHMEGGDVAKATKAFNDLVLMANIAPKQQKNLLTEADTFGTLIEQWEKNEPIPEPDPQWADVDGIKRSISTWFFGHLCKMFKVENDWAQLYDEELTPYTAHPPSYEGDFDLAEDADEEDGASDGEPDL